MKDGMIHEEELSVIQRQENESNYEKGIIERNFMEKLNYYLTNDLKLKLKTSCVPGDGSCMYHAILESFQQKYGYSLIESSHVNLRKRVTKFLLDNINEKAFIEKFRNDEPNYNETYTIEERYVQFCDQHMNDTTNWPIELCLFGITKIYGLQIIVLAETNLENGVPGGEIFQRLITEPDLEHFNSIIIGNRGNQHYYSTGNNKIF